MVCKTEPLRKTSPVTDLMTDINLCKTEGTEVVVCSSYCWFYGLSEEFLNKLANKRPHLFYSLRKKKNLHGTQIYTQLQIFFKAYVRNFVQHTSFLYSSSQT